MTGASSGIGAALARELADRGYAEVPLKSEDQTSLQSVATADRMGVVHEKIPIDSPMTPNGMIRWNHHPSCTVVVLDLVALIEATGRFAVCGETDDAPTGREMFVENQPRLVALGLTLRRGSGFELIKDFRRLDRAARLLVVSARRIHCRFDARFAPGRMDISRWKMIRPKSYRRSAGSRKVISMQAQVSRSGFPSLATNEIEPARSEVKALSDRELQVFSLIGRGFGASRLATELHLSVKTIETYQAHIKEKLGLHSAAELSESYALVLQSMRRNLQLRKLLKTAGGL